MRRVGRVLDAQVPRRADGCIAVSDDLREHMRRAGIAEQALTCIEPAAVPAELDHGGDGPGIDGVGCYAGNLDGYQNLEFLLCTFARIRSAEPVARLVLVSHPDARGRSRRLA